MATGYRYYYRKPHTQLSRFPSPFLLNRSADPVAVVVRSHVVGWSFVQQLTTPDDVCAKMSDGTDWPLELWRPGTTRMIYRWARWDFRTSSWYSASTDDDELPVRKFCLDLRRSTALRRACSQRRLSINLRTRVSACCFVFTFCWAARSTCHRRSSLLAGGAMTSRAHFRPIGGAHKWGNYSRIR